RAVGGGRGGQVTRGGTCAVPGDTSFQNNLGGLATINNTGTFLKSGGTGSTAIGPAFNNNGTLNVQSGTMSFYSGGDSHGTFNARSEERRVGKEGRSTDERTRIHN